MSSILTTKTLGIIGGIAGVSAVGGGLAYGAGLFSDSKTEQQEIVLTNNKTKLEEAGFTVLDTEADSTEWQTIFTQYNKAEKGTFKGIAVADKSKTNPELRAECRRQLALNTNASYKLARQWCVKQETMSAILGKKSRVLNIATGTNTDDTTWSTKITSLTTTEKTTLGLGETADVNAIKTKCKEATDKKTTDAEFNEKFEVAKRVCTVAKN